MGTTIITEHIDLVEGTLDAERRTVDVVLIRPGWSQNGRYYSKDVLAKAAGYYENTFAFADHQSRDQMKRGESRSVKDITGRYTSVHIGAQGELRATRHIYNNAAGDAVWPVIEDAVRNPGAVRAGLSHTAIGTTRKGEIDGREGDIVEGITGVFSVDDVVSPAAGGEYTALAADTGGLRDALLEAITFEEWQTARPEFVEKFKKMNERARQTDQERAALAERDTAQAEVIALQAEVKALKATLQTALSERDTARESASRAVERIALEQAFRVAHLPVKIERELREEMENAPPDQWDAMLEKAKRYSVAAGGRKTPVTGAARQVATAPQAQPPGRREFSPKVMAEIKTPEELARIVQEYLGG